MLCDFLVIQGFLSKLDGRYALAPDSALFLIKSSPVPAGAFVYLALRRERAPAAADSHHPLRLYKKSLTKSARHQTRYERRSIRFRHR